MRVSLSIILYLFARYAQTQARYRTVLAREWALDVAWREYRRRARAFKEQRRAEAREMFRAMLQSGSATKYSRTA